MLEKDINLEVTLQVGKILQSYGVQVGYSRTTDVYLSLEERANRAKAWGADYLIAIHHNAGGGMGAEGYHSVFVNKGKALVDNVLNEFKLLGQSIRGNFVRWNSWKDNDYYGIIRDAGRGINAVLIEYGFIDTKDAQKFDSVAERSNEALAYAKGILKSIGIAYVPPKKQTIPTCQYCIDFPKQNTVYGNKDLYVQVWGVSVPGVMRIDMYLNGKGLPPVATRQNRPDVKQAVNSDRHFKDGENCGFGGNISKDLIPAGKNKLDIAFINNDGSHFWGSVNFIMQK